jgi:hypothetical protein
MRSYSVAASAELAASAAACYAVIADYRNGHPQIVPPSVFGAIEVEEGGVGAGTRIRVAVRGVGGTRTLRLAVTEPEPGRVLAEHDVEAGTVTHFTVDPVSAGRSRVTIRTDFIQPPGLRAALEGWITRRVLPRVFREELARLESVAGARAA